MHHNNIPTSLLNAIKTDNVTSLAQHITPQNIEDTYTGCCDINYGVWYFSKATALHLTTTAGSIKCTEWLLMEGANIETLKLRLK